MKTKSTRQTAVYRILAVSILAFAAAGCSRAIVSAGENPGALLSQTEQALAEAEKLGAPDLAAKQYDRARLLLEKARRAESAGQTRTARNHAEKAGELAREAARRSSERGEATIVVEVDPSAENAGYRYTSLDDCNHLMIVFEGTPTLVRRETRGPILSVRAEQGFVDVALVPRVYVVRVQRNGESVEILARRRGPFWPAFIALFADSGVAERLNRGDSFQPIDVLRFVPYVWYIPKTIDAVKIGKGDTGCELEDKKTGFRKVGDLSGVGRQLTIRCRFQE